MARRPRRKKQEEDELERAQREVRELKATNRALLKRLKKVDREYAQEIEKASQQRAIEDDYARTEGDRPVPCQHCGKGSIVVVDIVGRKFERCSTCDYRKRIPKKG